MANRYYNSFRQPMSQTRRLVTYPDGANWNTLLNYWARTYPFPGYDPQPYPGEPMPDEVYQRMMDEAVTYLGYSYTWGGKYPPYFDCSGFVGYLYKNHGIIPESVISYTGTLHDYCTQVPASEAAPGDLCFWNGSNGSTWEPNAHVGIYIGNGMIIDCSGKGVAYRAVTYHNQSRFAGYFRVPPMPTTVLLSPVQ